MPKEKKPKRVLIARYIGTTEFKIYKNVKRFLAANPEHTERTVYIYTNQGRPYQKRNVRVDQIEVVEGSELEVILEMSDHMEKVDNSGNERVEWLRKQIAKLLKEAIYEKLVKIDRLEYQEVVE